MRQRSLAKRHIGDCGTIVLHDISSSCLDRRCYTVPASSRNGEGKSGEPRITYVLLCNADGCPVAVEVFAGSTTDPTTFESQVRRIRRRFSFDRVVLVWEGGWLVTVRIREGLGLAGLDLISALKARDIRKLLDSPDPEAPAPNAPEAQITEAVAEIIGRDFPGVRLKVCLNSRLREKRAREREELLHAAEERLQAIAESMRSGRLMDRQANDGRLDQDASPWKVASFFDIAVTDGGIAWIRREDRIVVEARLDGVYVIRTRLDAGSLDPEAATVAYRCTEVVMHSLLNAKIDFPTRPVHVPALGQIRAHIFLGLLALYVEWQMRRPLAPLFPEEGGRAKSDTKRTADGSPVNSLRTVLDDLATLTLNQLRLPDHDDRLLSVVAQPTPSQKEVFDLLGIGPGREVPTRLTIPSEPTGSKSP